MLQVVGKPKLHNITIIILLYYSIIYKYKIKNNSYIRYCNDFIFNL